MNLAVMTLGSTRLRFQFDCTKFPPTLIKPADEDPGQQNGGVSVRVAETSGLKERDEVLRVEDWHRLPAVQPQFQTDDNVICGLGEVPDLHGCGVGHQTHVINVVQSDLLAQIVDGTDNPATKKTTL